MSSTCFRSLYFKSMFLLPLMFRISITTSTSLTRSPLCNDHESSVLLRFKESFVIDMSTSTDPFAYSKLESWKQSSDCCLWDGVKCDNITGHVIGLDLGASFLHGSLTSNNSLFQLVHLRKINLAYNNFNHSPIPFSLGYLFELTLLNLSNSFFSGQIPSSISQLRKLSLLDLSNNNELTLRDFVFDLLIRNLTNIEHLHLDYVNIVSPVPKLLPNKSSLQCLSLHGCRLYGEFPSQIFQLPNLQVLDLAYNSDLDGHLPEFNSTNPLQILTLSMTGFSGNIPPSIGELGSLRALSLRFCKFFGQVPYSFGNLTRLDHLDLSFNNFEGQNFSSLLWIGKQTKLTQLGLTKISIKEGEIPPYFANLTMLSDLIVSNCQLRGQIPSWLMKMETLSALDLNGNNFEGPLPSALFQLKNLESLDLAGNRLSGTVDLNMFLDLKKLTELHLSHNNLTLLDEVSYGLMPRKFTDLGFGSCKLRQFPRLLQDQDELRWLDLSDNNIHGQVPAWVWNTSRETMETLVLSNNFLTGFESISPVVIPWSRVIFVDISSNMLQGRLPMPPSTIQSYNVSNNNFSGQLSPLICERNSLHILDLSFNNLSETLPQCLGNSMPFVQVLDVGNNNFWGTIPKTHTGTCLLRMFVLDNNQLDGKVPRSLANCTSLEFLSLENNRINDVFPSWLRSLHELKVLILRSNHFHGMLSNTKDPGFPKLRIIDVSRNNFSGPLPMQYLLNWNAMKTVDIDQSAYMEVRVVYNSTQNMYVAKSLYSMSFTTKGIKLDYAKILQALVAIDFSNNKFEGNIPVVIGNLQGLRILNLSNNALSGEIPSSIANLSVLESLDLSSNELSGEIPQQLQQLNFLEVFNVSNNRLTGPIPHGQQFDTFENSSYIGNSGLCGPPLSRKCGDSKAFPAAPSDYEDSGSLFQFGWKPVAIGYGTAVPVGVVIGHIVTTRYRGWFERTFRLRQPRITRQVWNRK